MKKSITQKYPAKAESILSSCFVIKPATNNKLEYCEAKDVLWDTGATNTIISRNIADALGLEPSLKHLDRKSTRLNSSHLDKSSLPYSA